MKKILIAFAAAIVTSIALAIPTPDSVVVNIAGGSGTFTNTLNYSVGQIATVQLRPSGNTGTTNTCTVSIVNTVAAQNASGGTATTWTNVVNSQSIAQSTAYTLTNGASTVTLDPNNWVGVNGKIVIAGCGTNTGAVLINLIRLP